VSAGISVRCRQKNSSMDNIEIQVNAVEPCAEGQPFGETGSYLRSTSTRRRATRGASSNTRPIFHFAAGGPEPDARRDGLRGDQSRLEAGRSVARRRAR
jgi:hypothetical protein